MTRKEPEGDLAGGTTRHRTPSAGKRPSQKDDAPRSAHIASIANPTATADHVDLELHVPKATFLKLGDCERDIYFDGRLLSPGKVKQEAKLQVTTTVGCHLVEFRCPKNWLAFTFFLTRPGAYCAEFRRGDGVAQLADRGKNPVKFRFPAQPNGADPPRVVVGHTPSGGNPGYPYIVAWYPGVVYDETVVVRLGDHVIVEQSYNPGGLPTRIVDEPRSNFTAAEIRTNRLGNLLRRHAIRSLRGGGN